MALIMLCFGSAVNPIWWILVSAATLGITVTNWSIGLIATLVSWPFRSFILITLAAFVLVSFLAIGQWAAFAQARPFFLGGFRSETQWTQPAMEERGLGRWDPVASMRSLFVSTVVAPSPVVEIQEGDKVVTNQQAGLLDRTPLGQAAAVSWMVLLFIGVWGAVRTEALYTVGAALGLMLTGQAVLHSIYGDPTFMYSPHVLPLLVAIAAMSWFTPVRKAAMAMAIAVAVLGGANNVEQFQQAAELAKQAIAEGGNNVQPLFPAKGAVLPR